MIGALIILAVTVAVGVLLWAWEHWRQPRHGTTLHHHHAISGNSETGSESNGVQKQTEPDICCGLHAVCEKTGRYNDKIIYYDDEDLDRFRGRSAEEYSDEETEEFRDVLLTMLPEDVPGWAISLEKRGITVPASVAPELELLMIESL